MLALLYLRAFLRTLPTNLGDLAVDHSLLDCCPCFYFLFLVFVGSPRFADVWGWVSSLRGVAGPDESCGNDVEDKLALELEEPVDNPGTKIGTKFSVLHRIISHRWSAAVFDHCPTHVNIWVLRRVCLTTGLQACHRGFAHRHEELKVVNVYLWLHHLFALLHWLL